MTLVLFLVLWMPVAIAARGLDSGVDPGIGILGPTPPKGTAITQPGGFPPKNSQYKPTVRQALEKLVFRRQPFDTHPVMGHFVFSPDGIPGIQTDNDFYPVFQNGLDLGDGSFGLPVLKRQGNWVDVIISQAPQVTGWVKLTRDGPVRFWLWYFYMARLVQTHHPLVFITPVDANLLYQPDSRSLSYMKEAFQVESGVLMPLKLDGAYMQVKLIQQPECPSRMPVFQTVQPVTAWIRWIEDNGRPKVYRYTPPDCG